jgi:hypothetical protein
MPSAPNAMYRGDATSRPAMTIKTRCQAEISNRLQTQCVVTMTSLSAMRQEPGSPIQNALLKEFEYDAVRTCAGDSSSAHACPVQINTGVTMRQFRLLEHTQREECVTEQIADRRGMVEAIARASMLVENVCHRGDRRHQSDLRWLGAVSSKQVAPSCISCSLGASWMAGGPLVKRKGLS